MESKQSISLADRVFEKLEQNILSGHYKAGEILTENRLGSELEVSRTPVREAIRRLEQEGLLKETGKGMQVIGVCKEDLEDIYEIRLRIEGYAVKRATERMSAEVRKELENTLDLQEFYTQKGNPEHIRQADSDFHAIIYENCGSAVLKDMLSMLHRRISRFRGNSVTEQARAEKAAEEHRCILEAIKAGDGDLAERLSVEHIQNARDNIISKETELWD